MPDFSHISAAILAGGLGTRLRSVVPDKQKVLAEVLKRPFVTFLLEQLDSAGVRNVVLCTGHKGDEVQEQLGNTYRSLSLAYSQEDEPLGTAGALRQALPRLNSDPVLVMNGDSYANADLNAFLEWFSQKELAAALVLTRVPETNRYGRVILDKDSRVQIFEEKGGKANPGWISAGIYLFRKELLEKIPPGKPYSLEREFFPLLVKKGLYGYPCKTEFLDVGTPDSYAEAELFLKAAKRCKKVYTCIGNSV